jgi:hypothetical protein
MKRAILFWCYKAPELCEDRVRLLRRNDPDAPLYVLFGGDPGLSAELEARLAPLVDDFWVFDRPPPPGSEELDVRFRGGTQWKYYFGDLLIAAWFEERGHALEWDTVVVVQWDMLVFGRIDDVFGCLEEDQVLFSGLRPIAEVEDRWAWTTPDNPAERARYEAFLAHVRERHGYDAEPQGYVAVVTCLSRAFLERFAGIERPDLGFLEYRLPIYAQVFGTPICREHPFRPWWGAVEPRSPDHTLRARPDEISAWTILRNLRDPRGARVFHPYWRRTPRGVVGWTRALVGSARRRAPGG